MGRITKGLLTSLPAGALCLAALVGSHTVQRSQRLQEIERDTGIVASQFADRLDGALEKHRIALGQLASFVAHSEGMTEERFHDLAAATLGLTPLCLRISAIDHALRVHWVYPPQHTSTVVGFDLRDHPEGLETMQRAMTTRREALSAPLGLLGGDAGFELIDPVFKEGEFQGAMVCSFKSADFFNATVLPEVLERYDETVLDGDVPLFASAPNEPPASVVQPALASFDIGGRTWHVKVRPRAEVLIANIGSGQVAFWSMGCLLSLVTIAAVFVGTYHFAGMRLGLKNQGATLVETQQRLDGLMQQQLQAEKLTALGELVAGVAHEINNPLASILGYTQLTLGKKLPAEVRRRLVTVSSEAERAGHIVRNLLTFARKHPAEKRYLGLNGIIEKTLELKAYHFRVNRIHLEKDLAPDLPMTMLDFHQIQQVLLNLLNNAEQAMAEAGKGGTIRVTTRLVADRIEARVTDTGPGVPAVIQGRLFEPFFTTKKEGKGTGLGLSLCYGIMQEHAGGISLESRPGAGATFIIQLPVLPDTGPHDGPAASSAGAPAEKLSVFIIDDEPNMQSFLVELLSSRGHAVDTASDVPEALKKLATKRYDLVITDMRMPNGTGKDIYRAVAEKSPDLAKRIIFTTGDGASAETQAYVRKLGNEILLKPFTLEAIERAMAVTVGS